MRMSHFEIELAKLRDIIRKIGVLAEVQVGEAAKAIMAEPIVNKEVKKTEQRIDKLDIKIDEICQNIFALQQPLASDLRFIMSAMQISNEFERVGDLSLSIIKKTKNIKDKHDLVGKFDIEALLGEVVLIIQKTNLCFETNDEKIIGEIFILNKAIKTKSDDTIHFIINEMKTHSKVVVSGTHLVMVLKHLERISEHCTNIAESIYFMVHSKIIKHDSLDDVIGDS